MPEQLELKSGFIEKSGSEYSFKNVELGMFMKKIFDYYKKMSITVKASLWFTICNIFQKGIGMITVPIFTRIMTVEEYGVYSVFQSWYNILIIIATLNLFAGVLNKGMVKYENDRWGFLSSIQLLSTTTTILCFFIYLINTNFWNGILGLETEYVLVLFVEFLFVPSYLYWSAKQRYEYKYISLLIVTILMSLLSPTLGLIMVLNFRNRSFGLVFSYGLVQICFGLMFYIYIMIKGKKFYIKNYWKYALLFNLPLIPHYLSQMLLIQVDRIMINKLVGVGEAAIYSVAYNISLIMSLITNSLIATFIPTLYSDLKSNESKDIQDRSFTLVLLVGILTIVTMLLGPELISVFADKSYSEAVWIIPPVAMSVYFNSIYSVFVNIEFYFEKTRYVMYITIMGACLNIFLNYKYINTFGYIAAGYITVICYMLFSIGHYFAYRYTLKKLRIFNTYVDIRKIVILSLAMIVIMFISLILYKYNLLRYSLIVVSIVMTIINRKVILYHIRKLKV